MMIRAVQILSTLTLLFFVCGVGGIAANNVVDEALPGASAFQARQWKENLGVALALNAEARAAQRMAIIDSRLNDFSARAGTAYEARAFTALEEAMDAGVSAIAVLPADERIAPLRQIAAWMEGERALFAQTAFARDTSWLAAFDAKTAAIRQASQDGMVAPEYLRQIAAPLAVPAALIVTQTTNSTIGAPRMVPMPTAFKHSFPLAGAHVTTPCEKCHAKSIYEGTPRDCISCHRDVHNPSLGWGCAECHTTVAWKPVKKK